jgi:transcriptional regulator with XRE-family HTH domain
MTKGKLSISEVLRQAIAECGQSFKKLEQETGVLRQSLMKFALGEQSLRLDMAEKLADYFGLELVQRKGR